MEESKEAGDQRYAETEGELIQFWSGNPQNDIWHGRLLVGEAPSGQYLCCPSVPTHIHIIEFC